MYIDPTRGRGGIPPSPPTSALPPTPGLKGPLPAQNRPSQVKQPTQEQMKATLDKKPSSWKEMAKTGLIGIAIGIVCLILGPYGVLALVAALCTVAGFSGGGGGKKQPPPPPPGMRA